MKKRSQRWGCLLSVFLLLAILLLGGGYWFYRSQVAAPAGEPPSVVLVTINSPSSGDEVKAGDYVSIDAQAVAPQPILNLDLFIDGKSFASASSNAGGASWTWQAWPLGIHTFSVRATAADGQVGNSQTVLVNVLAGDGVMEISATEGQTPAQVGAGFGVPPEQVGAANPNLPPNQPLQSGQPVKIPIPVGGSGNGSGLGQVPGDLGVPVITILWKIKFTQPVDKSYCYTSAGDGKWEKMPKDPFTFFNGVDAIHSQVLEAANQVVIQVDCWGWLAGALKYLGQGQAKFDATQPPPEVVINGQGFILNGLPKGPPIKEDKFLAGGLKVPPPYSLRKAQNETDCTAHGHPILAPFICKTLMKNVSYMILVWEWSPKFCPIGDCQWYESIDGYRLYEIDPVTKAKKLVGEIKPQASKVAAVQVPWGVKCYGVEAFVNTAAAAPSEMSTYCPGDKVKANLVTLFAPAQWLTSGGEWMDSGDCSDYGGLDNYMALNQKGFGNQNGQVLVGSYMVDDDGCYQEGYYTAGLFFDIKSGFPSGAAVEHAVLRFSKINMNYGATGFAAPEPASCIKNIGRADSDWSGLSTGNHYSEKIPFKGFVISSMGQYSGQVDVTSAVKSWVANPAGNHGFFLSAASAPYPLDDGSGKCLSGLGNFQLDIYYFAP